MSTGNQTSHLNQAIWSFILYMVTDSSNTDYRHILGVFSLMHFTATSLIILSGYTTSKAWHMTFLFSSSIIYQSLIVYGLTMYLQHFLQIDIDRCIANVEKNLPCKEGIDINEPFHIKDIYQFWIFIEILTYFTNLLTIILSVMVFSLRDYTHYIKADQRKRENGQVQAINVAQA